MKIVKNFIIILATLILTACAYQPNFKFDIPDVEISRKKIDAELKSISVEIVHPLERNGRPFLIVEREIPMLFQKSLKDAFDKNLVFKNKSNRKVDITVKIFRLKLPTAGLSMTTEVGAKYEIIDRKTEDVLFSKDIFSSGVASMEYILGASRSEESINRAIVGNIAIFLQNIYLLADNKQE